MPKITDVSVQAKNSDRVNISVDGSYRFSLDVFQAGQLGIKIENEYSEQELEEFEIESIFGKLYAQALEYTLMRPHSSKEVRDYLWRKTVTKKYKAKTGEIKERKGVSQTVANRVYERLDQKGYINDEKFAKFWVEHRNQTKGSSLRKLTNELRVKGVSQSIIEQALQKSERRDIDELQKVLMKKRNKYDNEQKLIQYLQRQGFRYDEIRSALSEKL